VTDPRTWRIDIRATFEADNAEDAEAISQRLMDRVLEHPCSIEAEAWTEEVASLPAAAEQTP